MTWTRAHNAWIARECEGLDEYKGRDIRGAWVLRDGSIGTCPNYNTDPAACIRAAEAWKAQRPNNRWWGVRHEGDHFAWACESSAGASERVAVNSGHGEGESVPAVLASALYIATGGPA
jgi:hypothetical protein